MSFDLPDTGHQLLVALALQVQPGAVNVVREGVAEAPGVLVHHARSPGQCALLGDDLKDPDQLEAKGISPSAPPHVLLFPIDGLSDVDDKLEKSGDQIQHRIVYVKAEKNKRALQYDITPS